MDHKNSKSGQIIGLIALLATVAFLIIGFTVENSWHLAWIVFLIIPIASIIADIAKNKHNRRGKVTGIVSLLCVVIFLLMGFLGEDLFGRSLWHPGWIIFFAIPITDVIMKLTAPAEEKPQAGADTSSQR